MAIRLGGIGTIGAVMLVAVYLAWVVVPLFLPQGIVAAEARVGVPAGGRALALEVDEYRTIGWRLIEGGGVVESFDLASGRILERVRLSEREPVAWRVREEVLLGFEDGSIVRARVGFQTDFPSAGELGEGARELEEGETLVVGEGVVQRSAGQLRRQRLSVSVEEPVDLARGSRILLLDEAIRPSGPLVAALTAEGRLELRDVRERRNLLTGEVRVRLGGGGMAIEGWEASDPPAYVRVKGVGDAALVVWEDGRALLVDTRDTSSPAALGRFDLTPDSSARITALRFLVGGTTLLVGDDAGGVAAWFPVVGKTDWKRAHVLREEGPAVSDLASSDRSRLAAAAFADGSVELYYVTSGRDLGRVRTTSGAGAELLSFSPGDDLLLARAGGETDAWEVAAPHPEATLASISRPVWYEGFEGPAHVWQSTGGTDAFEPKFGLGPLVFGTIKATFYSMLVAAPLALLAAAYTSEFLHARWRARVKPLVESMAGLPSVVLGFLAALVIAPAMDGFVPEILAGLATTFASLVMCAYVWQALTTEAAPRARRWRLLLVPLALGAGIGLAFGVGPVLERVAFAGDFEAWADGQIGGGRGGWLVLLMPVSLVVTWAALARAWGGASGRGSGMRGAAWRQAAGFGMVVVVSPLVAWAAAVGLERAGFDPRGEVFGTYAQQNALVVGFVIGFAVIPIIYTIAEEALSAVPEHLRAASLGAGATVWQTTIRIVVPTAMSGLFSAVMIGLGRAVGETMIVLMAAGNTPIMDWNIFNGFRTLSANIAVELPEAVKGGTHYRMLFLAALVLFAMTFVLNTGAELVRMRFRRRAMRL